mmetsp:Transcript_20548/g.58708  ORF Transcript_20548/g.58708 Transcript_20548/m.58708 type:complete len:251 (+) Transcript_20548:1263-2015(+)
MSCVSKSRRGRVWGSSAMDWGSVDGRRRQRKWGGHSRAYDSSGSGRPRVTASLPTAWRSVTHRPSARSRLSQSPTALHTPRLPAVRTSVLWTAFVSDMTTGWRTGLRPSVSRGPAANRTDRTATQGRWCHSTASQATQGPHALSHHRRPSCVWTAPHPRRNNRRCQTPPTGERGTVSREQDQDRELQPSGGDAEERRDKRERAIASLHQDQTSRTTPAALCQQPIWQARRGANARHRQSPSLRRSLLTQR